MRLPCKVGDNVWNNDFGLRGVVGRAARQGHIVCLTKKERCGYAPLFCIQILKMRLDEGRMAPGTAKQNLYRRL